jgi:hypothetical protein
LPASALNLILACQFAVQRAGSQVARAKLPFGALISKSTRQIAFWLAENKFGAPNLRENALIFNSAR